MYSIVIVGGGTAAASVAYHLHSIPNFSGKVLLLESGEIGKGDNREFQVKHEECLNKHIGDETTYKPWVAGGIVFDKPNRIKMIVTMFSSTAKEFIRHNGMKGLAMYNSLCSFGREKQISLAKDFLNGGQPTDYDISKVNEISDSLGCIRLGSLLVCLKNEVEEMKEEFELLKQGGFEVEWWDKSKVDQMHGEKADFHAGMFFPKDGVIDSVNFPRKLIEYSKNKGMEVREHSRVNQVIDLENEKDGKYVQVVLDNKEIIYAKKVVMATGGLFLNDKLAGILKPIYGYLTAIKNNNSYDLSKKSDTLSNMKNAPNFLTHGFTIDWTMCQGYMRISGEDHNTALKVPRLMLRCKNMENFGLEKYPYINNNMKVEDNLYCNGVYSETPDTIPLLGSISDQSNIFYIVGDNGWGQAILSGASYLVPGILGERKLSKEEQDWVNFTSIRRFNTSGWNRPKF